MRLTRPRSTAATALFLAALGGSALTVGGAAPAGAVAGGAAAGGDQPFTVKLDIGGKRSCTGALVEARWVATAASCFADDPQQGAKIGAGAPALRTTATVGRTDITRGDGHLVDVAELVPREDRDLVLARLAQPVFDVAPVALATTAPAKGDVLRAAGYGRTKDAWVPDVAHNAAFTVDTVGDGTLDVSPAAAGAAICKGDTGGPAYRERTGGFELAALNSRSWQGGCLGESETRTSAVETRVDDISQWIQQKVGHRSAAANEVGGSDRVRWADWDGDGKADYLTVGDDGAVSVYLNRGGDGHGGWQELGQIARGVTTDRSRVRFADFDGDGKADYLVINQDGSVTAYLNRGGDGNGGWQVLNKVAAGMTTDQSKVRFADWDGDGKADYLTITDTGTVSAFLNRGGDGHGGWQELGQIARGVTGDRTRLRFADLDGDGRADYLVVNPDGAVTAYLNRGGDDHGDYQLISRVANGLTTDHDRVQFADFTGDGHADYVLANPDRSVTVYAWNGGDGNGGWSDLGKVASGA
ncbi:FG-GAP-like repeat-containing protein [Kitasatospora sp. NPDC052896]|uniref:FG-GAP-like repeat-containing protein n=1 Tax=Kitasatospora sp. NPDC052896 TaxID=3364061 RepID=UPI0037C543A2